MKTKTNKTEIEFDSGELVSRVEGFAAGHERTRERKVKLPRRSKSSRPGKSA